jgi:hypothetical protein
LFEPGHVAGQHAFLWRGRWSDLDVAGGRPRD